MARITEGAPRARVLTQALALALAGCSCQPSDDPKPPSRTEDSGSQVDTPTDTDTDTSPPDPPEPYTGPYPLTPADRTWVAGEPYDEAGRALDVGDADGDGLAEVLIGTPSGFVYGPDADLSHSGAYLVDVDAPTGTIDLVAFATFHGDPDHNADYFGLSLGVVGDVSGDGLADVLIEGEVRYGSDPGLGFPLFAGPHIGVRTPDDLWSAISVDDGTRNPPHRLTPCGDVTGDGRTDVCLGSGLNLVLHQSQSKVYVLSSVSPGLQPIEDAAVELVADAAQGIGVSLAGGADLTGDGVNDLVIGADERDERRGGAYLSWDNTRGVHDVSVEGALWSGVEVDEQAGLGLAVGDGPAASGTDLDGDGLADAYVGAHLWDGRRGRGFVVTTKDARSLDDAYLQLQGESPFDWFGVEAAIGDLDGDGFADLAVGVSRDIYFGFDQPGRVALFRGPLTSGVRSAGDADAMLRASDLPDAFGFTLDAGDVDGDGRADLAIGAPFDETVGTSAGAVSLYLGANLPW